MVQTKSKLPEKFEISQNKDVVLHEIFFEEYLLFLCLVGDHDQPDVHP